MGSNLNMNPINMQQSNMSGLISAPAFYPSAFQNSMRNPPPNFLQNMRGNILAGTLSMNSMPNASMNSVPNIAQNTVIHQPQQPQFVPFNQIQSASNSFNKEENDRQNEKYKQQKKAPMID